MDRDSSASQCLIDRELGRGSYGSVYLLALPQSHPQQTTLKYALKVIDEHGARAQDRDTAHKELRIMRGLHHPSIVALVDSFEINQRLLLVLELCEGGDLRSFLDTVVDRRQSQSGQSVGVEESLVLRWAQQLAAGLEYLHQKKILHRDLKPQNIFLKDKFNIKIGDLGIARQLIFTKQMADTHIGTPLYISPEIYQGNPYSYKTDVWSLGCCVYEMMTLKYAFHAPSRFELVGKVVNKQVLPLPECYCSSLRNLVISMLYKDPEHRPHAGQLVQSLEELDSERPQPPWKRDNKGVTKTDRPERPSNASSLQIWRLGMAKALNSFLSKKQAAQSAQLAAALAENMSLSSIRDIEHSSSKSASSAHGGTSRRRERQRGLRVSTKLSGSQSVRTDDDDEETVRSSLEFSETSSTIFYDQTSDTMKSSQSFSEDALSESDYETVPREMQKENRMRIPPDEPLARKNRTRPQRPHSKDHSRGVSDSGESNILSEHGNIGADSFVFDRRSPMGNSEYKHVKIGKSSIAVKPRPLPYPKLLREHVDSSGYSPESHSVTDHSASNSLTSYSLSEEQEDVLTQSNDSLRTLVTKSHQTGSDEDVYMARANEIMEGVRARLSSPAPQNRAANDSQGYNALAASGEAGKENGLMEDFDAQKSGKEKGRHAAVEEVDARQDSFTQENAIQEKVKKKKRNFLRERKGKHTAEKTRQAGDETTATKPSVEKKDRSVTLFTRGQRVTFTNQKEHELDLTIGQERVSLMKRAMGEARLRAAVSIAALLDNSPALLQFQLRELLGREIYKQYAAAIVEMARR